MERKIYLSILLALLLSIVSVNKAQAYDITAVIDEIYYHLTYEGRVAEVTYGQNYSYEGDIVIPETINYNGVDFSVTSIGRAFYNCFGVTSVVIPNSVTTIGDNAFYKCIAMTSVIIGNNVTTIGNHAFDNCSSLTSLTIPNSVTSIGLSAFYGCSAITSITIGKNVHYIREKAFKNCTAITSVHISDLASWCNIHFYESYSNPLYQQNYENQIHFYLEGQELTNLVIPDGVTSIGNYAFVDCMNVTSVVIPNSITTIGEHAFEKCIGLTSVTIPNKVTSIGADAFYNCSNLGSITIGNSVSSIGKDAFKECTKLTSVQISDIESWCKISFSNYASNPVCYADHLYVDGQELTNLVIPDGMTSIGNFAFESCISLTSVVIPNSITTIGEKAFYGCNKLTSVVIPNNVTYIGESAFEDCRLNTVTIGKSVTSIGHRALLCFTLFNVVSLIENPFDIYDVFYPGTTNSGTLYVPFGTRPKYMAVYGWKNFRSIEEFNDVSAIKRSPTENCSLLIDAKGGMLTVKGADNGTSVSIYGSDGMLSGKGVCCNGVVTIQTSLKSGRLAIVKVGEKTVKVVMK